MRATRKQQLCNHGEAIRARHPEIDRRSEHWVQAQPFLMTAQGGIVLYCLQVLDPDLDNCWMVERMLDAGWDEQDQLDLKHSRLFVTADFDVASDTVPVEKWMAVDRFDLDEPYSASAGLRMQAKGSVHQIDCQSDECPGYLS
jgi:hypothetical protein